MRRWRVVVVILTVITVPACQGCLGIIDRANKAVNKQLKQARSPRIGDIDLQLCFTRHSNAVMLGRRPVLIYPTLPSADACSAICLQRMLRHTEKSNTSCGAFQYNSLQKECTIYETPKDMTSVPNRFYDYYLLNAKDCDVTEADQKVTNQLKVLKKMAAERMPEFQVKKDTGQCPKGHSIMQKTSEYSFTGNGGIAIYGVMEEKCVELCKKNQLPTGAKQVCNSVTYNTNETICELYPDSRFSRLSDKAPLEPLTEKVGVNHYEKLCLTTRLQAMACPGLLYSAQEKFLVGYNQAILSLNSYIDCVEACLSYSVLSGSKVQCKSAMFYYEETSKNCLLNFKDHTNDADLFVEEKDSTGVTYFSRNLCKI